MKCEETAEFASRLCDGQVISRDIAEHIGTCEACRMRLNAYAAIGAELRRAASLEQPITLKTVAWEKGQTFRRLWWQEGRRTMKMPRFAFASMLALILLLSGGLVLVRARAGADAGESVLVLTFKVLPQGITRDCVITTDGNSKTGQCGYGLGLNDGTLGLMFRFVSRNDDRTQVGIKTTYKSTPNQFTFPDDLKNVPERMISIEPDHKEKIMVPGVGEIELTGQYLDHVPLIWQRPRETLEPGEDEFRVVAPVLIRGNEVACDLNENGYSISNGDADATLMIYCPGQGRYLVSRVPFGGAVEATVTMGEISFKLDGRDYRLLSAMPMVRGNHVWVSHDSQYKPSQHIPLASDTRPMFRVRSLKMLLRQQIRKID
jgi:hypothetical protein